MRKPSVQTLMSIPGVSLPRAECLRAYMQYVEEGNATVQNVLEIANGYMDGYGVESILNPDDVYGRLAIEYVNTGDTYNVTLTYDHQDNLFRVCSWGDLLESLEKRGRKYV